MMKMGQERERELQYKCYKLKNLTPTDGLIRCVEASPGHTDVALEAHVHGVARGGEDLR